MDEREAREYMQEQFPDMEILNVVPYKNRFVFSLCPKGNPKDITWLNDPVALDRETKELTVFNPLLCEAPPSGYDAKVQAGKETIEHTLFKKGRKT